MSPENADCLIAARIDCCVLANNHVLDWGTQGLEETLDTLHGAQIRTAGAGRDTAEAAAPAVLELAGRRRLLVFAFGMDSAGVPADWAATATRAGVSRLPDLSSRTTDALADRILAAKRAGDLVLLSMHWGSNWGYEVSRQQRSFARRLIDAGAAELVHGHSSHHPRPIEIYRERLILYGCGDFLNDYEGISGHETFRPELALMYFPRLEAASGKLLELALGPTRTCKFRVGLANAEESDWLAALLRRESAIHVERTPDARLRIR
jgi:poly-gamma-glutamate synthesis protein (capsule biosynthesis protein)